MKKIIFFALLVLLLQFFGISANAYPDSETESIAEEVGADGLENEFLDNEEISGDKSVNVFEKTFLIISKAFSENGKGIIGSYGAVLGVLVLCCVMSAMKFGGDAIDSAIGYISVLALSGVCYSLLYNLFVFVIAAMQSLMIAVSSMMPIMAGLYVMGGSAGAGAASSASLSLFLSTLSMICTKVILPLLQISFALCITSAMPQSVNLSSVTNLVKNTSTTVMAFIFTLLGFVLFLQTAVGASGDTFVARSVRFASGVFVPVIGGMLGDAVRTVIGSVSVIKGTVGVVGVVIVLSVVIPPLVVVLLHKLLLLGCSIIAKVLGCERESALLCDLGSILSVLLALVIGAGVVAIIAFAVFIKTGVTV